MKQEDIITQKIHTDFEQFRAEMLKCSKEQIFNNSYEISSKEDITGFIEREHITPAQRKILLSQENILNFLYDGWSDMDVSKSDDISECLSLVCDRATQGKG